MQESIPVSSPSAIRKLYVAGVVAVVCVAAFAFITYELRSQAVAAERDARSEGLRAGVTVLVAKAHASSGIRVVDLPGDVRAFRQVTLYAKLSGYLQEIHVDKGDRVAAGQVLAVVESPETDQQVLSLKADLAVKKQVQARYRALVSQGVVSQAEMDRANADVEAASAEFARLEALEGYEVIRAPFAGTITARYVDPGALVPAATGSTQSAQPLVDLVDMRKVRIFVYVGQSDAPHVHEKEIAHINGDEATVSLDAPITRISRALDPHTRTMLAEIDLDNRDGQLYPGLFVHVTLNLKTPTGLTIPADAVVLRQGAPQVAVVEGNQAHFRPVQLGDHDGQSVRVLGGLKEGDMVGLHVGDEISDGVTVQPVMR